MRVAKYKVSSGVHAINLDNSVHRLLSKNRFIDVTLACDGQKMRCHRLVLAAASPLFEELLMDNPTFHPTVIMPLGLKASTIKTLIDFMYTGEANVTKTGLTELVESAEVLQVGGMFDASTDIREYFVEVDDDQVEEEPEGFEKHFRAFQFKIHHVQERGTQTDPLITEKPESKASTSKAAKTKDEKPKENIIDFIEIEDSVDIPSETLDETSIDETTLPTTENSENTSNTDSTHSDTAAALIANDNETILQEANRMKLAKSKPESMKNVVSTLPKVDVQESVKRINLLQLTAANRAGPKAQMTLAAAANQTPSKTIPWTYIHIPTVKAQVRPTASLGKPAINRPILPKTSGTPAPWTIYQPLPQLGPGQAYIASPIQITPASALKPTPITSFLKFNSSSMQISVKNLDRTDKQEKLKVVNMALEKDPETVSKPETSSTPVTDAPPLPPPPPPQPPQPPAPEPTEISLKTEPGDGEITMGSTIVRQADFPMFYAMIKKEQDDLARQAQEKKDEETAAQAVADAEAEAAAVAATEAAAAEAEAALETAAASKSAEGTTTAAVSETEAEDIICQPSVSYIYDDDDDIKDDIECEDDEAGVCIDYDRLVAETYGIEAEEEDQQKQQAKPKKQQKKRQYKSKKTSSDPTPSFLMPKSSSHRYKSPPTLVPLSVMSSSQASKHYYFHHKPTDEESLKMTFGKDSSAFTEEHRSPKREEDSHSPQTVILRSPRCNQPRHYSTDSLYSALMAVKHGESIYRASRQHAVPRKTLRNWMKRWDIKSKFPMPKQLKDAAKKKKLSLSPTI